MAKHYPQITSVSIHPGVVKTDLLSHSEQTPMMRLVRLGVRSSALTPEKGAHNTLWAATALEACLENGAYYEPVGKKVGKKFLGGGMSDLANDEALVDRLWEWTEKHL